MPCIWLLMYDKENYALILIDLSGFVYTNWTLVKCLNL